MTPFAIAGVQMHVSALHSNVEAMRHRIEILMARFPWTQMVVFSELAPYGPLDQFAQPFPNDALAQFQDDARRFGIWLIPGSMFEKLADGRIFNTSVVINPQGEIVKKYAKMFPFKPYEQGIASGTDFCVFDVPDVGRFGLSICYDIWFPETTRQLTSQGVEVLLHPVLTGTTDRDAEIAIARATAAQFQCYVFDVNGLGAGGVGRSLVVDPTATVLHQSAGQEDMFPIEIDLDNVRRQRETGLNGLGQVLKSFRDREADFPIYDRASGADAYLHTLGPLETPKQGSRAGVGVRDPRTVLAEDSRSRADHVAIPAFKGRTGTG
ncbi:carbon-nitrogen hydrolase family protein [Ruegeria sp. HKCCD8929]|uniref:carbon-nitrogen hydrolase family protein n=1 Tax=Ruegeria sp. HKCCD8929 TaxID=2683006 RepID=UPI0014897842|nr:carbon-nitrogen hydrolase family protein [Ruegeria sp. HKCCD8929]